MGITTIGQELINAELPEEFRNTDRVLSKSETNSLLAEIAAKYPERYKDISYKLMTLGRNAAFEEGVTLGLDDLSPSFDKSEILAHVAEAEKAVNADTRSTPSQKSDALAKIYEDAQKLLTNQTYDTALAANNPFALQVKSKARGSPTQLAALLTTPSIYQDAQNNLIPLFIRKSYAEGLDPHEFWAATYGARKGIVSTKFSTRDAGYLGKQLGNAVADLIVTDADCGTPYGIPVPTEDTDNIGAVLARDTGKYRAGEVITKQLLADLQKAKIDEIVVRSPTTCGAHNGVCKFCAGLREDGKFPDIGHHLGQNAASAIAERIAQGQLNVKHTSGQKQHGGSDDSYTGFDVIESLVQIPGTFPNRAALAEIGGTVESVEPAPQGGTNIVIDKQLHYAGPELTPLVKVGDLVDPGDQLSGGVMNPADIVRLKGIGEGRRYLAAQLTKTLKNSGFDTNRRNVEVIAKSLINHVSVDDPEGMGNHLPGDLVRYSAINYNYRPRPTAKTYTANKAVGKFMEQPALHYSIGTPITRNVVKTLTRHGITDVLADDSPPMFTPHMVSLTKVPEYGDDWMARLGSNYLKSRLLEDVQLSSQSDLHGLHPLPGIAKGVEFGQPKKPGFAY